MTSGSRAEAGVGLTQDGQVMGTPQYMAPEQARGEVEAMDERADVYALGAILYALLTYQAPVQGKSLRSVLERVAAGRFPVPRQRAPGVPLELEAATLKAMALDPRRRYPGALELKADVQAFLDARAVSAVNYRLPQLAWLWVRRNAAAAATGGAALAVLLVVGLAFVLSLSAARERAEGQADRAQREAAAAERARAAALGEGEKLREALEELRATTARERAEIQRRERAEAEAASKEAALGEEAERRVEQEAGRLLARGDVLAREGSWAEARARYREARDLLLGAGRDPGAAELALWETRGRAPSPGLVIRGVRADAAGEDARPPLDCRLAVSPSGAHVVAPRETTATENGVALWSLVDGRELRQVDVPSAEPGLPGFVPRVAAFAADDAHLLLGDAGGVVRLYAGDTPVWEATAGAHVLDLAVSPDGRWVASAADSWTRAGGTLAVWSAADGAERWRQRSAARSVAWVAGELLVGQTDGAILRLDPEDGRERGRLLGHGQAVVDLEPLPGGRVASASLDHSARLWQVATGAELRRWSGQGRVLALAADPQGARLLVCGGSERATVYDVARGEVLAVLAGHTGEVYAGAFLPDGDVVTAARDGTARVWTLAGGAGLRRWSAGERAVTALAAAPSGLVAASGDAGGAVTLWDVASQQPLVRLELEQEVRALDWSRDGLDLLAATADGAIHHLDGETGQQVSVVRLPPGHELVYAAFGRGLEAVAASQRGAFHLDLGTRRFLRDWKGALTPDAGFAGGGPTTPFVVTPEDAVIDARGGRWELSSGRGRAGGVGAGGVSAPALDRAGARVLLAPPGSRHEVQLWELPFPAPQPAAAEPRAALRGHRDEVLALAFLEVEGRDRAASVGRDGALRVWDVRTGTPLRALAAGDATRLVALPGARWLTADSQGQVALWDLGAPARARRWERRLESPDLGPQQRREARGRYLAEAGRDAAASDLLEGLRGLDVAAVHWRAGQRERARAALSGAEGGAPRWYLELCRRALE
ncbi:MAG: hypothetical protein R3F62_09120 [Planctomycetota bacterium]